MKCFSKYWIPRIFILIFSAKIKIFLWIFELKILNSKDFLIWFLARKFKYFFEFFNFNTEFQGFFNLIFGAKIQIFQWLIKIECLDQKVGFEIFPSTLFQTYLDTLYSNVLNTWTIANLMYRVFQQVLVEFLPIRNRQLGEFQLIYKSSPNPIEQWNNVRNLKPKLVETPCIELFCVFESISSMYLQFIWPRPWVSNFLSACKKRKVVSALFSTMFCFLTKSFIQIVKKK